MNKSKCVERTSSLAGRILIMALEFAVISVPVFAQTASVQSTPFFAAGNVVVAVSGCGVHGGTCTSVPNGTGTGTLNSSVGGYGDNQGSPLTLFQYAPTGTTSASFVNALVFPQLASGANLPVSAEYGSSSEGTLQLSAGGQYLTIMGYGINANTFNAGYPPGFTADPFGAAPSGALAQSGSLTGQSYTPVARVVALIDANGNVNSSTGIYNVFNTNNPRSVYVLANGTNAYISGQGSGSDATGGVFYTPLFGINNSPIAITGLDTTNNTASQDTRAVLVYNNTLYVSLDTKGGSNAARSYIGTLGTPPATSLFNSANGPIQLTGFGTSAGKGQVTITSGANSNGNNLNAGLQINLSPVNFLFASPSVLYVTDGGRTKQTSANSSLGDGGLQKWLNSAADGSGTWSLAYTLYKGLNLVANTNASGTTGLYGIAGSVSGNNVNLWVTNYTLNDLDQTYLYGITDNLTYTTASQASSETFTILDTAPADSNFKGVSLAPTIPTGSVELTSTPSGVAVTVSGTGCAPGTYTTPRTLAWTSGSSCTLNLTTPQAGPAGSNVHYAFDKWDDNTTVTSRLVVAPSTTAVYNANFVTDVSSLVMVTTSGFIYSRASGGYSGTVTMANSGTSTISGPIQAVFTSISSGLNITNETGAVPASLYSGAPYITATTSTLAPGASISFPIKFTYTGTAPVSFVVKALSGAF